MLFLNILKINPLNSFQAIVINKSKVIINNPSYILKDKLIFFSLLIVLILGPLALMVDIPLLQNILSSGMLSL